MTSPSSIPAICWCTSWVHHNARCVGLCLAFFLVASLVCRLFGLPGFLCLVVPHDGLPPVLLLILSAVVRPSCVTCFQPGWSMSSTVFFLLFSIFCTRWSIPGICWCADEAHSTHRVGSYSAFFLLLLWYASYIGYWGLCGSSYFVMVCHMHYCFQLQAIFLGVCCIYSHNSYWLSFGLLASLTSSLDGLCHPLCFC